MWPSCSPRKHAVLGLISTRSSHRRDRRLRPGLQLERLEDRQLLSGPTASFIKQDTTTQGNWIRTYGSQGYDVIGDAASLPSYATVTPAGQASYTWAASTTDPRALQDASGSGRIAACWYSASSFTVDVNLTDGQTHDLELYFLDWDTTARGEKVQISNASTGAVLDTETVTSFHSGVYLDWAVSGNVVITVTDLAGANAVLSGVFLDPPTTAPATTASFIKQDTTTQGNWIGTYGSQGYDVIGDAASLPSYATVTPAGQASYTWAASTTDPRALQDASGSGRIAACWYSASSFTVDVNLTDGQTHDLELYFLDWDTTARGEKVQISNASTGAVLDTETVTSFHSGVYLDWAVSGNVVITVTDLAGANAVLSGVFIDPPTTAAPTVGVESPASGATNVAVSSSVSAAFSEAVQASTISFTLANSAGTSVPAAVSYNTSNNTVTLTPSSPLAYGTAYTATVSGAKDAAGDPMNAPVTWSFTTAAQPTSTGDPTTLAPSLGPPPSPGPNVIWVSTQSALQSAFSNLQSGQTIVIEPGTYNLSSTLYIGLNSNITNVTVRGSTDNFNDVTLLGNGMDNASYGNVPMGISIWNAQNVTIADLSIGDVYYDPIEVRGNSGASAVTIYHVHLFDAGEQFIKVDPPSSGVGTSNSAVEYSLIKYTNGPPVTDHGGGTGYTNGIDIQDGRTGSSRTT